ncbi:MAG: LytTR family DNA-binding domain-containing protein [Oleispira sp.]
MSLRVLLVDDEPLARQRLARLLAEHENYEIVAEAGNGQAALDWLRQHKADLVLLDIQMPGLTGLEVAEQLMASLPTHAPRPAMIFCTAYDEYALNAFKVEAVDYLLKPIRKEDLSKALQKAQRWIEQQPEAELSSGNDNCTRTHISARTHQGLQLIPIVDIYSFQADQKYITVKYQAEEARTAEVLIDEPLKVLEDEFEHCFVRIHRNALVAKGKIDRLETLENNVHILYLKDLAEGMSVSRRHLPSVRKLMRGL